MWHNIKAWWYELIHRREIRRMLTQLEADEHVTRLAYIREHDDFMAGHPALKSWQRHLKKMIKLHHEGVLVSKADMRRLLG